MAHEGLIPGMRKSSTKMTQRTLHGTRIKKIRTSGFRARMASKSGRRILNGRRRKGRKRLAI
eukprot:6214843-Pleurochrysis_carterae.AAC.3